MTAPPTAPAVLVADDDEISQLFLVETLERAGFSTFSMRWGESTEVIASKNSASRRRNSGIAR